MAGRTRYELISHPSEALGKPIRLYDHLSDTGRRAARVILRSRACLNLTISADDLARAAFIAGCTHDFGKAKQQFQEYIRSGKWKDKDHAAISSVFTFLVASHVFGSKSQPTRLLPFVCAYVVNRHHGLLCNPEEAFEEASIEHQIAIARNSIDPQVWDFEFTCRSLDLTVRFSEYRKKFEDIQATEITEYFQKFSNLLRQEAEQDGACESWLVDLYFALLLVVASLTEADVACVIQAPEPRPASRLDSSMVWGYAFKQPTASESFQQLRERAWQEIQEGIRDPQAAFRLTLPTGLGKTLMGLYLSGVMQDQNTPRTVVYALPYLSIIEQTVDVARRVFGKTDVSVIQHHSLSFPETQSDDEPNFEKARFALEDWDADLVVTTFDQLFYSFLSQDRSFIRRFFRLPGSVFLLDEVQTIPARLIPAVETFLGKLRDKFGTKIIYMTATHPPFLRSIVSIVQDEKPYFESLRRTRLRLNLRDPIAFSDYLSQVCDWLLERKGKKILLVANTIRSARDLFARLSKLRENESKFNRLQLFYLSGSVVPIERLQQIKKIRQLIKENPEAWICVVSTQCVEAGVDLDMDEAVRDFAPWDSLLQICGRVNRFGKRSCADVWVYRWIDDATNREFHSYIYDSVFTAATFDVLADCQIIEEEQYYGIQQKYVQALERRLSNESSQEILHSALTWQFDKLDFQNLFRGQEKAWKVSVFCVADNTAEHLKEIAIELWSSKNPRRALELIIELCSLSIFKPLSTFLNITGDMMKSYAESLKTIADRKLKFSLTRLLRPMLQAYTISIPVRRLDELPHNKIAEGAYYFDRVVYENLNAAGLNEEVTLLDWIV